MWLIRKLYKISSFFAHFQRQNLSLSQNFIFARAKNANFLSTKKTYVVPFGAQQISMVQQEELHQK
jgi:hypothetical protein